MANNNSIYNAALAGATAAIVNESWITNTNPASYLDQRNAAIALATAIDAAIPASVSLSPGNAQLIFLVTQAVLSKRAFRTAQVNATLIQAIIALYNELTPVLEADNTAAALRGTNLIVNANGTLSPFPRPRRMWDWDYFWTGGVTSGTIGRMGWNLLGSGTPAYTRITASLFNSAKAALTTSAVANNRSVLCMGEAENRACSNPRDYFEVEIIWRQNNMLANKRAFFGWSTNMATDPLAVNTSFGIVYDSAISPNYLLISRSGGVGVPIDTGRVVPANSGELVAFAQQASDPTQYQVWLGASTLTFVLLGTITAPNFVGNHGFRTETLAAAVTGIEPGYWGVCSMTQETGVFASDTPLFGT